MHTGDWEESIDRAWGTCSSWWGSELSCESSALLRFTKLTPVSVARTFEALKARSVEHRTGSLWTSPEAFEPECTGTEESLEKLETGALGAMTIHYVWKTSGRRLEVVVTVTRMKRGTLRATLFTLWSSIGTVGEPTSGTASGTAGCDLATKFRVLLRHGRELLELLDVTALEVGRKATSDGMTREAWLHLTV